VDEPVDVDAPMPEVLSGGAITWGDVLDGAPRMAAEDVIRSARDTWCVWGMSAAGPAEGDAASSRHEKGPN
jgi:hypothetical protein